MENPIYRLGRISFSLTNCLPEFCSQVDSLLPKSENSFYEDKSNVLSIDLRGRSNLRELINVILRSHDGVIWIDAGCLISPTNKRYLIVGESSVGKSTLTMAMALGYEWKVVTEDLLLIDSEKNELITFSTPFSFKTGTLKLLKDTLKKDIGPLLLDEWLPLSSMAAANDVPASFDFAVQLGEKNKSLPFQLNPINPHQMVRGILSCSNILHIRNGSEQMHTYLDRGVCFEGQFGSLQERIDALLTFDGQQKAVGGTC